MVCVSEWGFSLGFWGWGGRFGALTSIFRGLVEWGVGGVVAGVVGLIMPVGCGGLPRVAWMRRRHWSSLSPARDTT